MSMFLDEGNNGLFNEDSASTVYEAGVLLPTPNERANWLYYDVAVGCALDSGIVVHRDLPQIDSPMDTLASCDVNQPDMDVLTGLGVNLKSKDSFSDTVQRMAHSRYWFRLWGQAMRVGEQIPIPGLKTIGGVDVVPCKVPKEYGAQFPQWAYNKIVGNYSGQILWYAQWSLWYTLASPPKKQEAPPQNIAQHIGVTKQVNIGMQAPLSAPDDSAKQTLDLNQFGAQG